MRRFAARYARGMDPEQSSGDTSPANPQPIHRVQQNVLARGERWLLDRLCARMPRWVSPDMLTFAGMVGALALYAPIFAERNEAWLDELADPETPGQCRPLGAYRRISAEDMRSRWDTQLPPGADDWREETVLQELAREVQGGASPPAPPCSGNRARRWSRSPTHRIRTAGHWRRQAPSC